MIYDSLDTIPYKLFLKIDETGDYKLLAKNEDVADEVLKSIWEDLLDQHNSRNQTTESKKILKLSKTIDEMLTINKVVIMGCAALKFEFDQEVYDIITSHGYSISLENTESYYADLEKVEREADAYIVKANRYKSMLPEEEKVNSGQFTIDDVMASICAILGFGIGKFNEVTYNEYYGHQKSVDAKVESIKKQKSINKNGK